MGNFQKAEAKFQDWRSKLIQRLQAEKLLSARDIEVLLRPPRSEHVTNLSVSYLSFPVWLAKYDHKMTRGLEVNLNSYRAQKNKHMEDVRKQLEEIAGPKIPSLTGKALLDEIGRADHEIIILPWIFWNMAGPGELDGDLFLRHGMNQTTVATDIGNATAEAKQLLTLVYDGIPDKANNTKEVDGTDAIINYTPHMFDSHHHGAGTSGSKGAAVETDEVLFHEMVHACRRIHGVPLGRKKVDQGYTSEEEYIAVVLSNIYLSEKGKKNFRAAHNNFSALPNPEGFLNNAQNVNLKPRDLIANFKSKQLPFYRDLARIPANRAAFNPIREYHEEQKNKRP